MRKIAIIGASYLQVPLINKAKSMGLETHVFAWAANDVGEKIADYFYPISITEKDEILEKCIEISIDGICTIASDLAAVTVSYVAEKMGLAGNSYAVALNSTNKHNMRQCFEIKGVPSPKSILVNGIEDIKSYDLQYPIIVKPLDRSGSRGITKVCDFSELGAAIENAKSQGFEKKALVEEFAEGQEYSVECISWKGQHHFLAMTKKYTTGSPSFIETGHIEPAGLSEDKLVEVKEVIYNALDSLGITIGASHSELKIDEEGTIKIIEIGGRMGGDFIGSHLVELSTGVDFVKCVIDCALNQEPDYKIKYDNKLAQVRFVLSQEDLDEIEAFKSKYPDNIIEYELNDNVGLEVQDSSSRWGYCLVAFDKDDTPGYIN